jgi:tRNA A37 methylthiotransferase MiaB
MLHDRLHSLVGSSQVLHVEEKGRGRTPCYAPVRFDAPARPADLLHVRIAGAAADHLTATVVA